MATRKTPRGSANPFTFGTRSTPATRTGARRATPPKGGLPSTAAATATTRRAAAPKVVKVSAPVQGPITPRDGVHQGWVDGDHPDRSRCRPDTAQHKKEGEVMASSGKKPPSKTASGGVYSQKIRTAGSNWEYVTPSGRTVGRKAKDHPRANPVPTKDAYARTPPRRQSKNGPR